MSLSFISSLSIVLPAIAVVAMWGKVRISRPMQALAMLVGVGLAAEIASQWELASLGKSIDVVRVYYVAEAILISRIAITIPYAGEWARHSANAMLILAAAMVAEMIITGGQFAYSKAAFSLLMSAVAIGHMLTFLNQSSAQVSGYRSLFLFSLGCLIYFGYTIAVFIAFRGGGNVQLQHTMFAFHSIANIIFNLILYLSFKITPTNGAKIS